MASRTRSSSSYKKNDRKGQFFILTTVAVVTILFFVGRWIEPLAQVDTSSIVQMGEIFTFDNIKEKTSAVVKDSESCDDLDYNLEEYKNFIQNFAREKNYRIDFGYGISSCVDDTGAVIEATLRILSENVDAKGTFIETWSP